MALVVQKCWNFFGGESKLIFKEKLFLTNEYSIPQSYVFYAQQIHVNMNSFYRTPRDFLKVDKLKPISSLHRMKSEQPSSVNSSLMLQCPLPSQQVLSTWNNLSPGYQGMQDIYALDLCLDKLPFEIWLWWNPIWWHSIKEMEFLILPHA